MPGREGAAGGPVSPEVAEANLAKAKSALGDVIASGDVKAPWLRRFEGGLDNPAFDVTYVDEVRTNPATGRQILAESDIYDHTGITVYRGGATNFNVALKTLGHELYHFSGPAIRIWNSGNAGMISALEVRADLYGQSAVDAWRGRQ